MFEGLSEKLSGIFDTLTRRGALSEEDVNVALRRPRAQADTISIQDADARRAPQPPAACAAVERSVLFDAITKAFSRDELRELAFRVGGDLALTGGHFEGDIINLIDWHRHRGSYADLVAAVLAVRPNLKDELLSGP